MSLRVRHAEYVPSISVAQNRPLTAFLDSVGSAPGRRAAPTTTSTFSLVSPQRNSAASSLWTAITARAARACAAPSSKSRPKRASAVLRMGLGSRKGSAEGVVAYSLPPESLREVLLRSRDASRRAVTCAATSLTGAIDSR